MPGQYSYVSEVTTGQNCTWRAPICALVASAAALTYVIAVSTQPTQHYVRVNNEKVVSSVQSSTFVAAPRAYAVPNSVAVAHEAPMAPLAVPVTAARQNVGQLATVAGGAMMLLSAALALGRKFFAAEPEHISLLSASGEKADESKQMMREMVNALDSADMRMLTRGATMEDIAKSKGIDEVALAIRADQMSRKDLTPKDVILEMQRGNGRFWMGLSERPDMNAMQRRALIMAQAPKICILSCSDSRVPVEIIFDQGLGEVFVVRMAGNILDANAHGSIEYAVKYLGVKVVLVIGHEGCGAVKGAITMSADDISKEPFDLQMVLQSIKSNLDVKELNMITDSRSREREAIVLNTSNQVKRLQQNQLLAEKVAEGQLLVAGAFYEISSGIVDFFSLDKNGLVIDI